MRKLIAFVARVLMPAGMVATFSLARRRFGDASGYRAGFAVYWAACAALVAVLLGPRKAFQSVTAQADGVALRPFDVLLLAWPPTGAIATRLIPELPDATRSMLATSAAVAEINAPLEELMWRAVYVELWPDKFWLGALWPSIGFALWHLAPQVIHPSRLGSARYVGASFALGLSWAAVAWRTRSVRWTTLSHVVTDGSGLQNSRYFIGD